MIECVLFLEGAFIRYGDYVYLIERGIVSQNAYSRGRLQDTRLLDATRLLLDSGCLLDHMRYSWDLLQGLLPACGYHWLSLKPPTYSVILFALRGDRQKSPSVPALARTSDQNRRYPAVRYGRKNSPANGENHRQLSSVP